MELAFEDIEVAIATATEEHDAAVKGRTGNRPARAARGPRNLPKDLPREEWVIESYDLSCPCGGGQMVRIGEERSERLDVTPAQFRVLVTIRPRYACAKGRGDVVQAKAAPAVNVSGKTRQSDGAKAGRPSVRGVGERPRLGACASAELARGRNGGSV